MKTVLEELQETLSCPLPARSRRLTFQYSRLGNSPHVVCENADEPFEIVIQDKNSRRSNDIASSGTVFRRYPAA